MHDRFHVGGRCWETGLELYISMLYVTNIHVKVKSFIVKDVYVLSTACKELYGCDANILVATLKSDIQHSTLLLNLLSTFYYLNMSINLTLSSRSSICI
jgi:hypothetical protein